MSPLLTLTLKSHAVKGLGLKISGVGPSTYGLLTVAQVVCLRQGNSGV